MNPRELTIMPGMMKPAEEYTCIRTGEPARLIPVTLRRMFLIPPLWIGWSAVVLLPLELTPKLAPLQYLRMLRPWIAYFTMFVPLALGISNLSSPPLRWAAVLSMFALPPATWSLLGKILDRVEFVRLMRSNKRDGSVTLRFSTEGLADRAREFLIAPEDLEPELRALIGRRMQAAPATRPIFRRLAGIVAIILGIAAVGIAMGSEEDRWKAALVLAGFALLMGWVALARPGPTELS